MNSQSRVLKWSLIIGLVVVINLFFGYSLSLIYKAPQYEAYCPASQVNVAPTTQAQCVAQGGQWNENGSIYGPAEAKAPAGYCDTTYTCSNNFQTAQKNYEKNVFVTLVILGALLVLIGNFLKGNTVISSGLSIAGVFSFIIASIRYWSSASDYTHVGILAIALAILFWIAYKKFKNG
jgi:hypothetical protein